MQAILRILIKMYSDTKACQFCYSVLPRHVALSLNYPFLDILNNSFLGYLFLYYGSQH